jgi:ABC-type glycerol-3-phosphate transport system substrate-binding protein
MAAWLFARHLLQPEIQAKLVQALFTLPVRESTWELMPEFLVQYPQLAHARDLLDIVEPLPISHSWYIAQWLLQDAAIRILPGERSDIPGILETLDGMIEEFEEMTP